jgi:hypothetical protein
VDSVASKKTEVQPSSANLKNTIHANFRLKTDGETAGRLLSILRWLSAGSRNRPDAETLKQHLDELMRRREGGHSLVEIARRSAVEPRWFRATPLIMKHYAFSRFDYGDVAVSLDILNAAGELGLPVRTDEEMLELFIIEGQPGKAPVAFVSLVRDLVQSQRLDAVFGGHVSFTALYLDCERGESGRKEPEAFLWPLTFSAKLKGKELSGLPVHVAEELESGVLIQVFEDLWTGYEDNYVEAAERLGLGCLWKQTR